MCGVTATVYNLLNYWRFLMRRRSKMTRKRSKKMFTKHARKVHKRNLHAHPMRGGFRV